MRPFAIAGVQMAVRSDGKNIERMRQSVDKLSQDFPWVQMVVFSELAACGHGIENAEPLPGKYEAVFSELARKHELWFVSGSIYEKEGDKIFNTATVFDCEGERVGRYRKMFPFKPYEEGVAPGTRPFFFDIPQVGRFGLSICYDLWFPETARWLVSEGVEVILHPSLTETLDRDVELSIVRATAACNQCYIVDVNGVAGGGNGKSIIVGPAGDILHNAGSAAELMPIELDLDRVSRSRELGLRGLGQPLKSFRDCTVTFPMYQPGQASEYFNSLGPLRMPQRGSRAGLERAHHQD